MSFSHGQKCHQALHTYASDVWQLDLLEDWYEAMQLNQRDENHTIGREDFWKRYDTPYDAVVDFAQHVYLLSEEVVGLDGKEW